MTCIIGMEHEGKVYIGCDSISLNGWAKDITAVKKVFRKGDMLIGIAGNPRQMQILQYFVVDMPHPASMTDEEYLVRTIVEPARVAFRQCGFTETDNGRETGASFLIGYRGKLYSVENGFQLCRSARGYTAMGVGDDFALGALQALMSEDEYMVQSLPPEILLRRSLEVAGELSSGVCGPYYVEVLEGSEPETDKLSDEDAAKFNEVLVNGPSPELIEQRFRALREWAEGQINSPPAPPEPHPAANPPSSISL